MRLQSIRHELLQSGLEPSAVALGEEHSFSAAYGMVKSIIENDPAVTAVIGMTDVAAIAAIHAVHDCGLSVPGDISVIGFDDLPEAAYVIPSLTTVAQPIRRSVSVRRSLSRQRLPCGVRLKGRMPRR